MKKLKNWLYRPDLELNKKWWHRLFKVVFILTIIISSISLITYLGNSYTQVVNQWNFIDTLSGRLSNDSYTGKVVSIRGLHNVNEAISDDYPGGWSLDDRRYVEPFSALFLPEDEGQTFCSDNLSENLENIAVTNNIRLFSDTNPSAYKLYDDMGTFSTYLKNNSYSVKCLFIDSFTISNEDGSDTKLTFLRSENTSDYSIYQYKDNFLGFVLLTLLSVFAFLFGVLLVLIFYYKVFLYIVFGGKNKE